MPTTTTMTRSRRRGSANSSTPATSRRARSTPVQLSMFDLPIWTASLNAISSPASGPGAMPCAVPAGLMTELSGPAHAHASPSATPASVPAAPIRDTSGPHGSTSFASVALTSCLANKLQARMGSHGSTLYSLTWKTRTTPAQRLIYALRASVPRTSDSGFTGWPTPAARDYRFANARPWKDRGGGTKGEQLNNAVVHLLAYGASRIGSSVSMASSGQLSPEHSRWLMGLPRAWDDCGVTATRSWRPSRRRS